MRKLRALTGMAVVCGHRRIGHALRGQLSPDLTQLEGIWISAGLRGTRFIPAESLETLGRVAVMVDDAGKRGRMRGGGLLLRAVSTDGRRLGAITGAEIDELSFSVTALELSAGLWDDLVRQRARITRYTVNRHNGEVIVEPEAQQKEDDSDEERIDERADCRHADRGIGGDGVRGDELADRAKVEPEGQAGRQLGFRPRR